MWSSTIDLRLQRVANDLLAAHSSGIGSDGIPQAGGILTELFGLSGSIDFGHRHRLQRFARDFPAGDPGD